MFLKKTCLVGTKFALECDAKMYFFLVFTEKEVGGCSKVTLCTRVRNPSLMLILKIINIRRFKVEYALKNITIYQKAI